MILINSVYLLSKKSLNLIPPFSEGMKNRVGYWELNGSAKISKNAITLSSSNAFRTGSVWSSLPLPYGEWGVNFNISIEEVTSGGGFNILVVKEYGSNGEYYGGSQNFTGFSIAAGIFKDNRNNTELHFSVRKSDGNSKNTMINKDDKCDKVIDITDKPFIVQIQFLKKLMIVKLYKGVGSREMVDIKNITHEDDLTRHWIGITSLSNDLTSKICLNYIKFLFKFDKYNYDGVQMRLFDKLHHIEFKNDLPLRNPSFNVMNDEIKLLEEKSGDTNGASKTIDDYFRVISELNEVLKDVSSYSHLDAFVTRTLVPYSQKWYKRVFSVTKSVKETKEIMLSTINESKKFVLFFNSSITETIKRTDTKLVNIKEVLDEEEAYSNEYNERFIFNFMPSTDSIFVMTLRYTCILETIGIISYVTYVAYKARK